MLLAVSRVDDVNAGGRQFDVLRSSVAKVRSNYLEVGGAPMMQVKMFL